MPGSASARLNGARGSPGPGASPGCRSICRSRACRSGTSPRRIGRVPAPVGEAEPTREVEPESPPLERMARIAGVLEQSWYVLFSTSLGAPPPRPEVGTLLVLELVRLQRARAQQQELFVETSLSSVRPGRPPSVTRRRRPRDSRGPAPELVGQLEALLASDGPLPVERIGECPRGSTRRTHGRRSMHCAPRATSRVGAWPWSRSGAACAWSRGPSTRQCS